MKLTNKLGLPQALVDAVKNDPYENGGAWRSVTQLISPPRATFLKIRHDHEIEEDVSDRLFSLYGQIVHEILRRANSKDLVEERLFATVNGRLISGGFDVLQLSNGRLSDWKFSTVYKVKGDKSDWVGQTNLLSFLFRIERKIEVKETEIVLLMRDHQKMKAWREPGYPQLPAMRIPTALWPEAQQKNYLLERIRLHEEAEKELPFCTEEERWVRDSKFAIMKKGHKRAVKLHDTKELAEIHQAFDPDKFYIEDRPGVSTRCVGFCVARNFCSQYKSMKVENNNQENEHVKTNSTSPSL